MKWRVQCRGVDFDCKVVYNQTMDNEKRGGKRVGAGRPAGAADDVLKRRTIYLTDAEWDSCDALWVQEIGKSEYIRLLVKQEKRRRVQAEQEGSGA